MISIKGLHKFFNKGKNNEIHVINDVNLDLPEKGMCAIFGKSGCGKTTLLNVIGGLDGFVDGDLSIEGNSIKTNTDDIRNRYIGYIFQNYNLNKSESCFDNIADALRLCGMRDESEIERRVTVALRNVGMDKYANRTPDTLSGGQQQRIAIARAIVKNPRIILADEPTGNLDESNTVMIMDLLSEIAKNHLVILVTHEENLVDAYCNKIIELSDGKIIGVRDGRADRSVSQRSKQDIYLGEFEKKEITSGEVSLEYYGEPLQDPIKLKIVNKDGRLYLQLGNEKVHIIDGTGEVKLVEGVYEAASPSESQKSINMEDLSEIEGDKYGSLFTLKSSIISGYLANFKGARKGKKALRRLLTLFAAVVVLMSSIFGSAIGNLMTASDSYNHNVFYVYTDKGEISDRLLSSVGGDESGIDEMYISAYVPSGDVSVSFRLAGFETFGQNNYSTIVRVSSALVSTQVLKDTVPLAGSTEITSDEFILISDKVADEIIEKSSISIIKDYDDLIGMTSDLFAIDGKNLRVAGVVASGERAVYMSEMALAQYAYSRLYTRPEKPAGTYGLSVSEGKAILIAKMDTQKLPKTGEKIMLDGLELEIERVLTQFISYNDWVKNNMKDVLTREAYFINIVKDEHPDLVFSSQEFAEVLSQTIDQRYFEYYEYYHSFIDMYIKDYSVIHGEDIYPWLYLEKGIDEIKLKYYSTDYLMALDYKATYGNYPTKKVFDSLPEKNLDKILPNLDRYVTLYEEEFYSSYMKDSIYDNCCLVSDADYITLSKRTGETHEFFNFRDVLQYTVVHSFDPTLTEQWLMQEFGDMELEYYDSVITPDEIFSTTIANTLENIVGYIIALVVIILIMSLCMYFIMRSAMMNRIKEIGVYRAIGVTKKNLVFRFAIESLVLALLTLGVGHLCTSGFVGLSIKVSPMVEQIFFYPFWYAFILLGFLCLLGVICGILPVLSLMRKTPSEILAKYDI